MHEPLRVVQEPGGRKTPTVLLTFYQQPPIEVKRAALADRRELRAPKGARRRSRRNPVTNPDTA